jgi:lipopolysaccharide export system permease protein
VKRLHYFILRSFSSPLLLTFVIVVFLLQMQFLWKYVDDLVGKGLSFSVLSELLLYASATFIPLALPLAILLASLMTFGNLGENYELTALKSSGISLWKIMYPLILMIVTISILAFFYSNISLPYFNWKFRSLLYDIQQQRPELQIKEGVYYNGIEGYSLKIGKKDVRTNLLFNLKIYDHTENNGNVSVTAADSGYIVMTADKRYLMITLINGESYIDMPEDRNHNNKKTYPFRRDKFKKQIINVPLEGLDFERTEEGLFRNNYQMMNLKQLNYATDSMWKDVSFDARALKNNISSGNLYPNVINNYNSDTSKKLSNTNKFKNIRIAYYMLNEQEKMMVLNTALTEARNAKNSITTESNVRMTKMIRLKKHEIEWHKKFTLSLACLIFFFIGAPLGAIIRKGGLGLPLVISVVFFILYYIISLTGEKMTRESFWPAWQGVWFSSMILLPIGIFLTFKSTNDSAILNLDNYYKLFDKIKKWGIWRIIKVKSNK